MWPLMAIDGLFVLLETRAISYAIKPLTMLASEEISQEAQG